MNLSARKDHDIMNSVAQAMQNASHLSGVHMMNLNQSTMLADASALNQTANMNNNYISINQGAGGPNYSQSGNKLLE